MKREKEWAFEAVIRPIETKPDTQSGISYMNELIKTISTFDAIIGLISRNSIKAHNWPLAER